MSTTTTTTSTIPGTTTTTTTTPLPLSIVQTIFYEIVNNTIVSTETSNASDSSQTKNNPLAKSFNYGTIAPGEKSKTIIIALNVPHVQAITNIRLGLIETGGITFLNNIFGINNSIELRNDITPDYYFQGVNLTKSSSSPYNISIPNKDNHTSAYVYLNVKLPNNQSIEKGIIVLKWWFDYAD